MNYSILNFRSTNTVDRLGIARALMKNVVSEYYITHYSSKDKITERTEFADAEQCYDAFQKLCFSYEEATHKDRSKSVNFPNEEWDEVNEEPAGYGNVLVAMENGLVTDIYELVNPGYYD